MEDFYEEELTNKQIIFKIILTLVIAACAVLLAMYLINKNTLHIKKEIKLEAGSTLSKDVKEYVTSKITNSTEYKIKVEGFELGSKVDKVGEYKYTVKFNHQIKEGKLIVVDTTAPEVKVQDLTIGVGDDYEIDDFIVSCEDYSKPCVATFKDDEDYTKAGTYDLTIVVKDSYNNSIEKKAKLIIKEGYSIEEVRSKDLEVVYTDPVMNDYKDEYVFKKFNKAYNPSDDSSEAFLYFLNLMESDLNQYIPSIYSGSTIIETEVFELQNKYRYTVGYAIKVTLSNGEVTYLKNNQEN